MSQLNLTILATAAIGLFSLIFLRRFRRVQWALFFAVTGWHLYRAVSLYGNPDFAEQGLLSLSFNGLGYLFFAGSALVTFFIALFSLSFNDRAHASGVAPLWTILLAANAGIFFSADWVSFIVSWEVMGWTSYLIISNGKKQSERAGMYYFAMSLIGTGALLAGAFVLSGGSGSNSIRESIGWALRQWETSPWTVTILAGLFTLAFMIKSAVFPFFMWPSEAHAEAPDDFSAFLSGIMIKYGVFGLVSIVLPLFGKGYAGPTVFGVPLFLYALGWIGVFTAVWGVLHAIREEDMKRQMAHSTVSNIGFIIVALSVNSAFGIAAALFHTFNHMVFKAAIFLSLGAVKYRTGERIMYRIGGMAYRMPVAFMTFLLGIIAAAGIPPMSGFASKWMVFQALFDKRLLIMAVPAFLASTAAFLYLYRGLHTIYLGQLPPRFTKTKPAPPLQSLAMAVLTLLIFAVGMIPGLVLQPVAKALAGMGISGFTADSSIIKGATSTINVTTIGLVFMGAFGIVMALYLIGKKRRLVDQLDTYTAGETPEDWNLTPEQYHYGKAFYEPFQVMCHRLLSVINMDRLFRRIAFEGRRLGNLISSWYNTPQLGMILMVTALTVILLLGVLG